MSFFTIAYYIIVINTLVNTKPTTKNVHANGVVFNRVTGALAG